MSSATPVMIDVREKDEFDAEHVEHSINLPLSGFESQAPAILRCVGNTPIQVMCRSGKRAGLAKDLAAKLGIACSLTVYEGGILEWKKQGKPTIAAKSSHLPIMRQAQLAAGALVLTGVTLSALVHPAWIYLSAFVGCGLMFAGATGFCGMAELLARMPWNKG